MVKAVLLALLAGGLTATSSICQRQATKRVPMADGFSVRLIRDLLSEPLWIGGVLTMFCGFCCQAVALHFGSLALVQPILASELLFVFAYVAMVSTRSVRLKDWLSAIGMAAGLGVFLFTADPSGGVQHPSGTDWILAGVAGVGLVALLIVFALAPLRRGSRPAPGRRAALLGVATGVTWGFLAAVIKEVGAHTDHGLSGLLSTWSPYVVVGVGAASILLSNNALSAGPLPASQPGFTIVDPLVASLLGGYVFREHLAVSPLDLGFEAAAGLMLLAGVISLSHSGLVHGEPEDERLPTEVMTAPNSTG